MEPAVPCRCNVELVEPDVRERSVPENTLWNVAHTEAGKIRGTCFGADFLTKKCIFMLRLRGSGRSCCASLGWESVSAAAIPCDGPNPAHRGRTTCSPAGCGGVSVINASVINPRPPKGAAASPLAPTPSAHDEEHRVVVAEEHLPK